MKKICISCLLLFILLSLASCGILHESGAHNSDGFMANSESISSTTEYVDEESSTNQISPYNDNKFGIIEDESSVNTDNLCMTIVCNYPGSQNEYSYFILCIFLNGDVWETTYSLNADGSDENKFLYKLYTCDDSVWTLVPKLSYLGRLELNDVEILTESITNIDLKSEYYSRENDITPDVEDSVYYTIYCYVLAKDGGKKSYHVKSYGDNTGCSYETMDVNAISIYQMIQNTKFYEIWLENHMY